MSDEIKFEPEKNNGVYLFNVKQQYGFYKIIGGKDAYVTVDSVLINEMVARTDEHLEIECHDYEIEMEESGKATFHIYIEDPR